MVNETNTTLAFAEGDAVLGLALVFCILLLMIGFKDKMFWILAGPVWMISSVAVFMEYSQWFMVMGAGLGIVLLMRGAYEVHK